MSHPLSNLLDNQHFKEVLDRVEPLDRIGQRQLRWRQLHSAKPIGSLGRLEAIASQVWGIRGTLASHDWKKVVVVVGGDHGVSEEGVSAYRYSLTAKLMRLIALGNAPVNAFARRAGASVITVDIGLAAEVEDNLPVLRWGIAPGTKNMAVGPAMSHEQAIESVIKGIALGESELIEGTALLGLGEIGIGNSTAASAITAVMCNIDVERVTGLGTGISPETLAKKVQIIRRSIDINNVDSEDPINVLSSLGGFEIGCMAGIILACAAQRIPVLIDGFITGTAAMLAVAICPRARHYLIASHLSSEPGHAVVLQKLQLEPILRLEMRLGQASGAALAIPIVESASTIVNETGTAHDLGINDDDRTAGT